MACSYGAVRPHSNNRVEELSLSELSELRHPHLGIHAASVIHPIAITAIPNFTLALVSPVKIEYVKSPRELA